MMFQSLSRDSGRLNRCDPRRLSEPHLVSIPQSGFGAFERKPILMYLTTIAGFNPSVGIRGV